MDAEIGQWSARRRRVLSKIMHEQGLSVVIGYTELHDDGLSIPQWALLLSGKSGQLAHDALNRTETDAQVEQRATELAGLCISFLESLDRRRAGIGGKG